jgi:hypothetical protein
MRRILFPTLGVVVLLLAYADQNLATGAPSVPRTTAQTAFPLVRIANEAKVLKHIAVAVDRLVESRAPVDPKERRLAKAIVRKEALIEEKADKVIADAHKAQTAQVVSEAEQQAESDAVDLSITGPTLTQEAKQESVRLQMEFSDDATEYSEADYAAMQHLFLAERDLFTTMSLSF